MLCGSESGPLKLLWGGDFIGFYNVVDDGLGYCAPSNGKQIPMFRRTVEFLSSEIFF